MDPSDSPLGSAFSVLLHPPPQHFSDVITIENQELARFWETKKVLFVELLMWEDERRKGHVAEAINQKLIDRVNRGKDEAILTIKYIRAVSRALTEYVEALKTQMTFLPPPKSGKSANSLKSGLAALAEYQNERCAKIRNLVVKLEECDIYRELIQGGIALMLVDFEHKTSATLGKIHALLTQLATCETTITSRFQDHTGAFRDLEAELSLGRHGRKCTWLTESRFLAAVKHEALIRRTLGQALADWSDELSLLDSTRTDSIKLHMLRFLTYQSELFLQIPENGQVSAVLESVSSLRTETKLLSNEETEALALVSGDTDPFRTMKEWTPKEAPRTHLVVKMGWIHKETGVFRQWQRCFAVLTNTHFMHFFQGEELDPFPDPILSVFLSNYKVFVSGDDFVFDLVETKQAGLLSLVSSPNLCQVASY